MSKLVKLLNTSNQELIAEAKGYHIEIDGLQAANRQYAECIAELEAKLNILAEICTDAGCEDWVDLKHKLLEHEELRAKLDALEKQTTPAIPLTDERIKEISLSLRFQEIFMGYHSIIPAFARAIEKAHGITAAQKPATNEEIKV